MNDDPMTDDAPADVTGDAPADVTGDALFEVASFGITPRALDLILSTGHDPWDLLERHTRGDWGDVLPSERQANDEAVRQGGRRVSLFPLWPAGGAPRTETIGGEPVHGGVVMHVTEPNGISTLLTPHEWSLYACKTPNLEHSA